MRGPPMPQRHHAMPISQQNSWNQSMGMNAQPVGQMDGGHLGHQQQWMNQSFQNGIPPGMNTLGLPYLPQNVLQDALALSVPVESADEPLLVQQIMNGLIRGESYKEILNSLHGKNGHSASLWKDYYLDHKARIDSWVTLCMQKEKTKQVTLEERGPIPSIKKPTIKKPSPSSFKTENSPTPTSLTPSTVPAKRPYTKAPTPKEQRSASTTALTQAGGSRRATINSLTAPAPVFDSRLPPPHADIKIPDPPSRSPTPPTKVIPQGRGNKYTPEDREFFIKFIQRALQKNPDLTRNELCEMVAERAPHHTPQSWASHWSINHDLPDKILAAARGKEYALADDDEDESRSSRRKRPKYRDPSTSEEEEDEEEEEDQETASVSNEDEDESDDDTPVKKWHEDDMGQKGEPFSEADMYIAAKYIAEFPRWHETTSKDRWGPFAEKYTQRSAKSWAEYYRRCEKEINRLARKIQREFSQSQRVKPSRTPRKE
ncbi:hypothetical protein MD484_g1151, partial [Candolleomyces efflorescens]